MRCGFDPRPDTTVERRERREQQRASGAAELAQWTSEHGGAPHIGLRVTLTVPVGPLPVGALGRIVEVRGSRCSVQFASVGWNFWREGLRCLRPAEGAR